MTALTGTIPAAGALAADVVAALDALGVDRALLDGAHECRSPIFCPKSPRSRSRIIIGRGSPP